MWEVKVTGKAFHILVDKCNLKASFDILMKKAIIIILESYILTYIWKDSRKKIGIEINSEKVKSFGIACHIMEKNHSMMRPKVLKNMLQSSNTLVQHTNENSFQEEIKVGFNMGSIC
jgi:hypothetical protein